MSILAGKTALITGGSSGLGLAVAKKLLEEQVEVLICGRDQTSLAKAEKFLSSPLTHTLHIAVCDVTNPSQVQAVVQRLDKLDIVINSAGVWLEGPLETVSTDHISTLIDTNLKGTIYVTQAALVRLKQQRSGQIVNISSSLGIHTRENVSVYSASKFGVRGFTEAMKKELQDTPIRIIGLYPGGMQTDLFHKAGNEKDTSKWIKPEDIAEIIVFALKRPDSMVMDKILIERTSHKNI